MDVSTIALVTTGALNLNKQDRTNIAAALGMQPTGLCVEIV